MARGEWILWLNVDDFLLPGVIDKMLKILQSGDRDLISCMDIPYL